MSVDAVSPKRWIVRESCGCRVPAPSSRRPQSRYATLPRIVHCPFHKAAEDMLLFIAELHFFDDPRLTGTGVAEPISSAGSIRIKFMIG